MRECLIDSVIRAASEMRVLFCKGQLGAGSSVSRDFDHVGVVETEATCKDADAELAAIEAGAQDFEVADDEDVSIFLSDLASLSAEALEEVEAFLAAIDDYDDVQNVFAGLGGVNGGAPG